MDPFLGEIRIMGTQMIPQGWHICDGSTLSITTYQALYAILGTTFGGDGRTTFGIPDLRGRVVVNTGQGTGLTSYTLASMGGFEGVQLTESNLPAHTHNVLATSANATTPTPGSGISILAAKQDVNNPTYDVSSFLPRGLTGQTIITLSSSSVSTEGASAAHENRMPYLTVNYIIALNGIFPQP